MAEYIFTAEEFFRSCTLDRLLRERAHRERLIRIERDEEPPTQSYRTGKLTLHYPQKSNLPNQIELCERGIALIDAEIARRQNQ